MNAYRPATVVAIILAMQGSAFADNAGTRFIVNGTSTPPPVADCVLDNPWERKLLQQIDDTKRLYTHPCNGGIYLADPALNPTGRLDHAVPVMQGWWLHEFISARRYGPESIEVQGRFITGIGPGGAKPFTASIRLAQTDGHWQTGEPVIQQISTGRTGRPVTQRIYEVTSRQELENLGLTSRDMPVALEVDFSGERLVVYPVRLTFGMNEVTDLAVTQDGESYQLHFRTHTSGSMSHNATTSLIWFTLPNDAMPVELHRSNQHPRAIPFHDFDSGVIAQGTINPRPQ